MPQDPDTWTQTDAVGLRDYIAAHPKFLRCLQKRRPKIEGTTMEARAVTGSDANGFLAALDEIDAMQRDPNQFADDAGYISDTPSNP